LSDLKGHTVNNSEQPRHASDATSRPADVNPYWLPPTFRDRFFRLYASLSRRVDHVLAQATGWALVVDQLNETVRGAELANHQRHGETAWRTATGFDRQPTVHGLPSTPCGAPDALRGQMNGVKP
jgi:hypothetical protein